MRQLRRVLMRPRLLRTRKRDYGRRREARRPWRPAGSGWSCSGSARGGAGNCSLTPGGVQLREASNRNGNFDYLKKPLASVHRRVGFNEY